MDDAYLQRRYLLSFESWRLPHIFTDVLVIGGGVAGLRAAIEAGQHARVIVLCKGRTDQSNSYQAQGGLAAVLDPDDSVEAHVTDTLATAAGLADEQVVRRVIGEAPDHVRQLRDWGVAFDTADGRLSLGREGGHSANRIVHAQGDATGKAVSEVLAARARQIEGVKLFDECFAVDLLTDPAEGGPAARCLGALTYHKRYGLQIVLARWTILAAGGAGMLWRETTNPPQATADSLALAFRAGAAVADAEMMQFHPTTLYVAGATRSLISEAVRGEGAYLVDRAGNRFMPAVHEQAELAPRDVVSRAIVEHMRRTGATHVYLDVRHLGAEAFERRFPHICQMCRSFDLEPARDLIPVHPAAHYLIGGAHVDDDGQTTLGGLLACGEAACTGLHGANRLASNSLIEALVFGRACGERAGRDAAEQAPAAAPRLVSTKPAARQTQLDLTDIRNALRAVMWRNVGIVRGGERLEETREIVQFWGRYVLDKEFFAPAGWEIQNMLTAAYMIAACAARRTETRGVHYRQDFPNRDAAWAHHQIVRRTADELVVE